MRIQIAILFLLLFSTLSFADEDKEMKELFARYDRVMDFKQYDLIEETFTKRFIRTSGGKAALISKIKGLPAPKDKKSPPMKVNWRKGLKGSLYFAKVKEVSKDKSQKPSESEFIILKEDGTFKIDGNISDSN